MASAPMKREQLSVRVGSPRGHSIFIWIRNKPTGEGRLCVTFALQRFLLLGVFYADADFVVFVEERNQAVECRR